MQTLFHQTVYLLFMFCVSKDDDKFQLGKTKIFFRAGAVSEMFFLQTHMCRRAKKWIISEKRYHVIVISLSFVSAIYTVLFHTEILPQNEFL